MNKPDSPFYLAVKHNCRANDQIWYKKSPLGKNEIGNFLSTAAKKANLQQGQGAKITNHSVRKTSISRLLDADIPENYVAQLSGHKSIDSLQSYKSAGQQHQRKMSLTLSRGQIQTKSNVSQSTSCNPKSNQSGQRTFSSSTKMTNVPYVHNRRKFVYFRIECVASIKYDISTSHQSAFVCWVKCSHHIWL